MKIYFNNDGTYGQNAVGIPVTSDNKPIGYICEVTSERVTCEIWDRFICKEQFVYKALSAEQDISSIGVETVTHPTDFEDGLPKVGF